MTSYAKHITSFQHWFRYWMPYTFSEMDHPKHGKVYLPLNREYLPLGKLDGRCDENIADAIKFWGNPKGYIDIWKGDPKDMYLYNDDPATRTTYFTRFKKLMARSQFLVGAPQL